ncbi:hypothetical protein MAHJHV51_57330 [Mycobacterium avium subsp. hominissuis]
MCDGDLLTPNTTQPGTAGAPQPAQFFSRGAYRLVDRIRLGQLLIERVLAAGRQHALNQQLAQADTVDEAVRAAAEELRRLWRVPPRRPYPLGPVAD